MATDHLKDFWRAGPGLQEVQVRLEAPPRAGVAVARLGAPPGLQAPERVLAWLSGCYAAVQRGGLALAGGEGTKESIKAARGGQPRRRRR